MRNRIIDLSVVAFSFLVMGIILGAMLTPEPDTRISNETVMSAYEAELFIDSVIQPHQYYLDHPEQQTAQTGNSEWQKAIMKEYVRLRNLVTSIK